MDKQFISRHLKELEKTGQFRVFNFNYSKAMPKGSIGFVDFVILSRNGRVYLIEVKLGNDKMRDEQLSLRDFCISAGIPYIVINEKNYQKIINNIIEELEL